ncbi:MAG: ATP-dependent helicase C-terminal domain-containing protein, partial [Rubripirellula sp.]
PPPTESVELATRLLRRLGAIDDDGNIMATGKRMATLPLHPRLARFMIEAAQLSMVADASIAASLLTERDPFRGSAVTADKTLSDCDVSDRVDRMRRFQRGDSSAVQSVPEAKNVLRIAKQIERMVDSGESPDPTESAGDSLKRALLAAYPDRVARRRNPGDDRGLMVGGRGVKLDRSSACRHGELFLCIDVDAKGTEASVRAASVVDVDWLDDDLVREVDEPFFNPSLKAVVARRRRYFDDLLLAESPIACEPNPEVAAILARQAAQNLESVFPAKDKDVAAWIERVRFLTERMPDLELPALDRAGVEEVLLRLCQTRTSIAQLRSAPWLDHFKGRYLWDQQQLIDKHAPAKLKVPSGNQFAVQYAEGRTPWMEVRIQELFGWATTPRIAGGRVPIQLHLLGPNYRPQQITEDLENFWKETYTHVRKELRRRYPKHHWPDDPHTATATPRGLKPR